MGVTYVAELRGLPGGNVDGSEGFWEKNQQSFLGSAPHEILTYGVKGTGATGGSYVESGRCS